MRRAYNCTGKLLATAVIIAAITVLLAGKLMYICLNRDYYLSFDMSAPRTVEIIRSYGSITDRNGIDLVNRDESYIAVINPDTADRTELEPHITDREKYDSCIDGDALFLCAVDTSELESAEVIPVSRRYSDNGICTHIIGYTDENGGVCGLEKDYSSILSRPKDTVSLSYSTDASGDLLEGSGIDMQWESSYDSGITASIDYEIQLACENAMSDVEKGAAVAVDIRTGDICAVVSRPAYDPSHPEYSLDSSDSPFINRAFSAYSTGSVFKLVIAGAALEYGIADEYSYDCTGSVMIRNDTFNCHRFGGHGCLDMRQAVVESCNPYFICLGRDIPTAFLYNFAAGAGFGGSSRLSEGIYSASGILPGINELAVPEEKANFCFGQGKLTATPLQVTLLTAAIANGGEMPVPVLVKYSPDDPEGYTGPSFRRVMSEETAEKLKSFMISTMYKENSMGIPEFTTGGGKTSTAQTWTYDEYGNEKLNCWFTGFFPADDPQYAVTVMIEEGISGNVTCGPVFAEIADSVKMRRYKP